jgi:hypothetical protein
VELAGVPWIQVHFVAWELGAGSYVVVRSLLDGSEAALNAEEMRVWHGTAPYLNGDHLMIELVVAEGRFARSVASEGLRGPVVAEAAAPAHAQLLQVTTTCSSRWAP